MKAFRLGLFALASLALLSPAWSDVRTLRPVQTLAQPPGLPLTYFGLGVAIDGPHLIVLSSKYEGEESAAQYALLYRRGSNGAWSFRRILQSYAGPSVRMDVRMKNGLAVVQFGDQQTIYEYSGGDYVAGQSATPIRHPGHVAISGNSILIGGDNCTYDGVVYQKGAKGVWGITGRMNDNENNCDLEGFDGVPVELNYDYALIGGNLRTGVHAWRRNGTALNWLPAGIITKPLDTRYSGGALGLQGATAVTSIHEVFRRSGTNWIQQDSI
jgi:hypothetical protein